MSQLAKIVENGSAHGAMTGSGQTIRFTTARDGVRLAWASSGAGPTLLKASNWITHLEYDWQSPVWRHWIRFFSDHFRLVRYDERGNGLSQHEIRDLSTDDWLGDLEAIVAAAKPEMPMVLVGISQGACAVIEYAAAHPEQVSHVIIYGGYCKGYVKRGDPDEIAQKQAIVDLARQHWGRPEPAFRRIFTCSFLPEGTEDQLNWFDELLRKTTSAAMAARIIEHRGQADVSRLLPKVSAPTLVLHANRDEVVPLSAAQEIAAGIPGAEYIELESRNHILLEQEPAWRRFREVVLDFTGVQARAEDELFRTLSDREREVLSRMVEGLTNQQIGQSLFISEKTVRNHVTHIFEKLGVRTRAQAMVFARDRGFRP